MQIKINLHDYTLSIQRAAGNANCTKGGNESIAIDDAFFRIVEAVTKARANGNKLIFIGNGGSATVASHMAEDFSKVAGVRALAFNDGALLTCLANDYSFEEVFEKTVEIYADRGDILFAISSSGKSKNILRGAAAAAKKDCFVVTLSGFDKDNPLSSLGDINIHTPSRSYGVIESTHSIIIHYLLDYVSGKLQDAIAG